MRVAVIGGAGYIGSHVAKALMERGDSVVIIDRDAASENLTGIEKLSSDKGLELPLFKEIDIVYDREMLWPVLDSNRIETVIHLAASAYVGESVQKPLDYYENNVAGTRNVLEAMKAAEVKKIVFSSSCATFGIYGRPILDSDVQAPVNPYGRTKLVCEWMIEDCARAGDIENYSLLRYFNVAGTDSEGYVGEHHDPETHVIPLLIRAAINGTTFKIFGNDYPTIDGTAVRDYIHVTDLARYHVSATDRDIISTNLGNGRGYSVLQLVAAVETVTGKRIDVEIADRRPGDPPFLVADAAGSWAKTGIMPSFNLNDMVESAYISEQRNT